MTERVGGALRLAFLERDSPGHAVAQQLVFALFLATVSLMLWVYRPVATSTGWLFTGLACVALATTLKLFAARIDRPYVPGLIVPLLDFAALGLCRFATLPDGAPLSILVFFPAVRLIIAYRVRGAVIAVGAVLASVAALTLASGSVPIDATQMLLLLILPVCVIMVAGLVNGLYNRLQTGTDRLQHALDQKDELSLRASRSAALLSGTGESVDTGILVVDALGAPVIENASYRRLVERFTGRQADGVEDRGWNIFSSDDAAPLAPADRPLARALAGEDFKDQIVFTAAGPDQIALSVSARTLHGESELHDHTVVTFTDVTATQRLIHEREEFIAMVSHELRTPLTSIVGYTDLALDEAGDGEIADYLQVVRRNSGQLSGLVEDLLLVQQARSNRFTITCSDFRLDDLIDSVVQSLAPAAALHGVTIAAPDCEALTVAGDEKRIAQVLDNLVTNAIKYCGRGGRVTIAARRSGTVALLTVADDGDGLSQGEVDQLFTAFFRGQRASASAARGVGLGLTVTRTIVEAHGGTIEARSTPGEGTAFDVCLPLAQGARP